MRKLLSQLLFTTLSVFAVPVHSATIEETVMAGRAQAARCDLAGAIATTSAALSEAEMRWRPDAPGLLAIHQDLATYYNRTFAPAKAQRHATTAVDIATSLYGPQDGKTALVTQNLAVAHAALSHVAQADALFARIVPILVAGSDPVAAVNAELAYGDFQYNSGRSTEGLARTERAAALARHPAVPPALRAMVQLRLADGYRRALRFAETARALDEADDSGMNMPRLTLVRSAIAFEQGKLRTALAIAKSIEKAAPPFDPCDPTLTVDVAHRIATIYMIRREVSEAESYFTRALNELARLKLDNNPREPEISFGLAVTATMARDYDRASALFENTAAAFRAIYAGDSEAEAQTRIEQALMLGGAGRPREGIAAAQRALALLAQLPAGPSLTMAYAHASLGLVSRQAGELDVADRELRLALGLFRDARGAASFDLTPGLGALGEIALTRDRPVDAQGYFRRAISIQKRWGGESALALGTSLSRLSAAYAGDERRAEALAASSAAVNVLRRRLKVGEAQPWNDAELERRAARSILTQDLVLIGGPLATGVPTPEGATVHRLFVTGQLANATSTGAAIAQMTTRLQQSDPALAALLGERGDLSSEWRAIQDELIGGLTTRRTGPEDMRQDQLLRRQPAVEARIGEIDAAIAARDPKLSLLLKSSIVDVAMLQAALRPDEATFTISVDQQDSYVVIVTKHKMIAYRTGLKLEETSRLVGRLRATLDPARWQSSLPPFDTEAASRLYAALMEPAEAALAGVNTLLVVPDGPLASLPFAVLLSTTVAPILGDPDEYKTLPWLVRRFAVVNYPSVASIVALRAARASRPAKTNLLGVGAPLFEGPSGDDGARRGELLRGLASARLADLSVLRKLPPLPDTKAELLSIMSALNASGSRLLLGADANERDIRRMPLDQYGVVVFATHGLVAGEMTGYAEPALALTPPIEASIEDDGLLSASEAAQLRLNADWVILSACNTAAGDGSARAEPLSGLAKSFFYAGARSLLVTHWPVDTEAAAQLTAATIKHRSRGLAPAMALRETELAFIDDLDGSLRTHPFFWAPYALIGD